jgi:hypothetical protein
LITERMFGHDNAVLTLDPEFAQPGEGAETM